MKIYWAQFSYEGDYEENISANKLIKGIINTIVYAKNREEAIELLLESYPNTYHKLGQEDGYVVDLGWTVSEIYFEGVKGVQEITNNTKNKYQGKDYRPINS